MDDYKELLQIFPTIIERAAFKSRILLVLDGLDQLTTAHRAHTLGIHYDLFILF